MLGRPRTSRFGWLVVLPAVLAGELYAGHARAADGNARWLGLRTGTVDTSREVNEWAAVSRSPRLGAPYVIQLDGPLTPERQERLAAAGVAMGDYLPVNAYIVTLDMADPRDLADLEFVRWAGAFRRAWKLDPNLGRRRFETLERRTMAARGEMAVEITLFKDVPADATVAAVQSLNGAVVHWTSTVGGHDVVSATIRAAEAAGLAELPEVQFVEEAPEISLRNSTNRWIVQSNVNGSFPLYSAGIHGEGQVIGIIDTAVDRNHCSFRDDVDNTPGPLHRKILAYNTAFASASHGTHVAGICVGDGGADDNNRGDAYLAKLVYNSIPPFNEEDVKTALELHHDQGARIHTNSWGDDGTTAYNGMARGIDVFSYEHEEDLVLFAVTNLSVLKNPENAKNLLAVGATSDSPSQGSHCLGGTGPTSDGRRKPEIYAPGCGTISSNDLTACSTTSMSGTSMACPAVAGAGMLVRQYFTDGFYPTGVAVPGDAFTPSGALIKATLLNSAVDMTGVAGYPSNQEGWGRVLLDNALYLPSDASKLFVDDIRNADGLSTGAARPYVFAVQDSGVPLKVTLVWTDPAAVLNASLAPVNDLDLELSGPSGGELYKGNVFSSGQSATGGASDTKNNVEQALLTAPAPGYYTVWVKATSVIEGPGNPFTQGYGLVVSGNFVQAPDCNVNGLADADEISGGTSNDCQANAVPDECDLAGGTSADVNTNGVPDECDPPPIPAAIMTGATSWKLHETRGAQPLTVNHLGRVANGNVTSECRNGGIDELRIQFDTALSSGVVALAGGAVTLQQQRTGDPDAGTAAGYSPATYLGAISSNASAGSELVLSFIPPLDNATTYRFMISDQVTTVAGQSIEVRGLMGDATDSGRVDAADRSAVVGVWTGVGYSIKTDIDLSGSTNAGDRSAVVAAWTGLENTAP